MIQSTDMDRRIDDLYRSEVIENFYTDQRKEFDVGGHTWYISFKMVDRRLSYDLRIDNCRSEKGPFILFTVAVFVDQIEIKRIDSLHVFSNTQQTCGISDFMRVSGTNLKIEYDFHFVSREMKILSANIKPEYRRQLLSDPACKAQVESFFSNFIVYSENLFNSLLKTEASLSNFIESLKELAEDAKRCITWIPMEAIQEVCGNIVKEDKDIPSLLVADYIHTACMTIEAIHTEGDNIVLENLDFHSFLANENEEGNADDDIEFSTTELARKMIRRVLVTISYSLFETAKKSQDSDENQARLIREEEEEKEKAKAKQEKNKRKRQKKKEKKIQKAEEREKSKKEAEERERLKKEAEERQRKEAKERQRLKKEAEERQRKETKERHRKEVKQSQRLKKEDEERQRKETEERQRLKEDAAERQSKEAGKLKLREEDEKIKEWKAIEEAQLKEKNDELERKAEDIKKNNNELERKTKEFKEWKAIEEARLKEKNDELEQKTEEFKKWKAIEEARLKEKADEEARLKEKSIDAAKIIGQQMDALFRQESKLDQRNADLEGWSKQLGQRNSSLERWSARLDQRETTITQRMEIVLQREAALLRREATHAHLGHINDLLD